MNRMVAIFVATTKEQDDELGPRAEAVGRIVAKLGCNLITGGGPGAMEMVAKGFCETRRRLGRAVGVIPGEADGLAWDAVDLDADGVARIDQALQRTHDGRPVGLGPTKTKQTRVLGLPPAVVAALRRL